MTLSEDVLALHEGILEVLILEESAGRFNVTDSASRAISLLSDRLEGTLTKNPLAPAMILGAATKFSSESERPRLVGILYAQGGIMFTYLDENKILALSASPTDSYDVMRAVTDGLPNLMLQYEGGAKKGITVKSASDVMAIARFFLVNSLGEAVPFEVKEISYDGSCWSVSGSHRAGTFRSKQFQVQVDPVNGTVIKFDSKVPSWTIHGIVQVAALAVLVTALGSLAWLILNFLFR